MMTFLGLWIVIVGVAGIVFLAIAPIIIVVEYIVTRRKEMSAWKELQMAETEQERRTAEACLIWEAKKEKEANDTD